MGSSLTCDLVGSSPTGSCRYSAAVMLCFLCNTVLSNQKIEKILGIMPLSRVVEFALSSVKIVCCVICLLLSLVSVLA